MDNVEPGLIETMASAEYENTDCSEIAPQTNLYDNKNERDSKRYLKQNLPTE